MIRISRHDDQISTSTYSYFDGYLCSLEHNSIMDWYEGNFFPCIPQRTMRLFGRCSVDQYPFSVIMSQYECCVVLLFSHGSGNHIHVCMNCYVPGWVYCSSLSKTAGLQEAIPSEATSTSMSR